MNKIMSDMKKNVFTGTGTAIITPFRDGRVDYFALTSLIERQIDAGVDAIVVCGTTGEKSTLKDDEHRRVIEHTVTVVAGRIPVVAGTGGNDTDYSVSLTRHACECGADAVLCVTPYYNKASDKGLIRHFSVIADASEKPVILYNVPSRTGMSISPAAYRELAKHPNIVATKEASGDVSAILRLMHECGDSLQIYSGNDDQTVPLMACGAKGVISTTSNVVPKRFAEMTRLALEGRIAEAAAIQLELIPLISAMFMQVNPIPVKAACAMMNLCSPEIRLPLCEMDDDKNVLLRTVLRNYGLIGGEEKI